jgi:predicted DsbA family dithiol-disulfide isomerase
LQGEGTRGTVLEFLRIMRVEIWSDIACPWCYVGKRRFETALARFEGRKRVEVIYRSYQLDPTAQKAPEGTLTERLAQKYRMPLSQAAAMNENMAALGKQEGIEFNFEKARPANTFDAHRLIHFASERGKQVEMTESLFKAYFTDGLLVSDVSVLASLAGEVGLDNEESRAALDAGSYASEVRIDQARARELGISGVPFFVLAGQYGVSGAQPADVLLDVLREVQAQAA